MSGSVRERDSLGYSVNLVHQSIRNSNPVGKSYRGCAEVQELARLEGALLADWGPDWIVSTARPRPWPESIWRCASAARSIGTDLQI